MRTSTSFFVFLGPMLALAITGCQPAGETEQDKAGARAEIEAAIEDWVEAFNRQDLDAVVAAHTEDIVSSFANEEDLQGRDALRDLYSGMFNRPGGSYTFEAAIEEVEVSCDMAYVRVIWTLIWHPEASDTQAAADGGEAADAEAAGASQDPRILRRERAMELWRKGEDGRWRLARWLGYEVDPAVPAVDTP